MPTFSYKAIDSDGKTISGTMEGASPEAVQNTLANQGQIPIAVTLTKGRAASKGGAAGQPGAMSFFKKVDTMEIIMFTKQMRTMLRAGIPITKVFTILQEQSKNPTLSIALGSMGADIQEGTNLLAAFKKHPHIFSKLYCGLINAGEASGTLPDVLDRVTYIMEHEFKVKRDIKSALAYPKMVLFTLFGSFFFLLNVVIPKFVGVFKKAGLDLPWPTKACLSMYEGIQQYWPFMLVGSILAFLGAKFYLATEAGALMRDRTLIKLPIVGQLFVKSAMSRFASILAILLKSGVTILDAFTIISDTIGNAAIAKEFDYLTVRMEQGSGISVPLRTSKFFPPMVVNMITIGEESGSLEDMLKEIGSHYDEEVEYAVAGLAEAIGPLMIVILTGVVGFFALAIFLPMWDMTKMVK